MQGWCGRYKSNHKVILVSRSLILHVDALSLTARVVAMGMIICRVSKIFTGLGYVYRMSLYHDIHVCVARHVLCWSSM